MALTLLFTRITIFYSIPRASSKSLCADHHFLSHANFTEASMRTHLRRQIPLLSFLLAVVSLACAAPPAFCGDDIPKAAWQRPIGLPVTDPGTKKPTLDPEHIDDGFWQGAPVGGFGAG